MIAENFIIHLPLPLPHLLTRLDINILEDPNIRIKLSEHSNWPTIPQLFVNGELIGGADITTELHNNGQLLDILDQANK